MHTQAPPVRLNEKRFADFFRDQPETGMSYWVATAHLKDGRTFPQVVVQGGYIARVRHHATVPFYPSEIDYFVVTHDKWDWDKER
jgi:hypothetical protein